MTSGSLSRTLKTGFWSREKNGIKHMSKKATFAFLYLPETPGAVGTHRTAIWALGRACTSPGCGPQASVSNDDTV